MDISRITSERPELAGNLEISWRKNLTSSPSLPLWRPTYERVPEIKFAAHPVDPAEERLCNCGAEELLMPMLDVKRRAKGKPVSLEALQALADHYRVSAPAMLIRLRNLGLWKAELVLWHEMTNGMFAVKRLWGGRMVDWQWLDAGIPRAELSAAPGKILSGRTFWVVETAQGQKFRPVWYQVKRHRGGVLALVLKKHKKKLPQAVGAGQSEFFSRIQRMKDRPPGEPVQRSRFPTRWPVRHCANTRLGCGIRILHMQKYP